MFSLKIFLQMLTLVFFIAIMPACQGKADDSHAPDFTLLNLSDNTVNLSDYRGKVVLINFFATYCPPCRMEMPTFIELQRKYGPKGFVIIGISVDNDPHKVLPLFIEQLGINFPVLLATNKVLKDYGNIYALPVTFILDKEHIVVKKITGMVNEEELIPIIKGLVEKKE